MKELDLPKIQSISLWVLFALILTSIPSGVWFYKHRYQKKLPQYNEIPAFQLTDQLGNSFSKKDMDGSIWVANFIFTSCVSTCPRLTEKMRQLNSILEKENIRSVKLVSFSVDPDRDTPKRLLDYSEAFDANPKKWKFLTGDSKNVEHTIIQGFKISMGKAPSETSPHIMEIIHGDRFVLLDQNQKIRGYYDVMGKGFNHLLADIRSLNRATARIASK